MAIVIVPSLCLIFFRDPKARSTRRSFCQGTLMKPLVLTAVLLLGSSLLRAGDSSSGKFPLWDGKETVAEYAKRAKLEPTLALDLGGGVTWEGMLIPPGTFVMGSPAGETTRKDDAALEKQHTVTLTQPFYIGKFELTQAQFEKVTGVNPSLVKQADLPVHNLAWKDAADFCEKMSKQTSRQIELPTEAQWEYACRAGSTTAYPNGATIADLDKIAWHGGNSGQKVHPCGQKLPNAWGAV